MKPFVSVLIDTYNHERFIEQAVVSVLEQDFPSKGYEILVVDDGSTDRTPEIVRKFEPRVRLLRKKNGGQASAFNAAFPELRGEIITFLDGDDWFAPNKLSAVMKTFGQRREISAVGHGYFVLDEETKQATTRVPTNTEFLTLATPEAARNALPGWDLLLTSALAVRRDVYQACLPISEALVFCGDGPIITAGIAFGLKLLAEPLSYYRCHAANLHSIGEKSIDKLRRKNEIERAMLAELEVLLRRLQIPEESTRALLDPAWVYVNRLGLSTFGGSRLDVLKTELMSFRLNYENPSLGYRLYKYVVTGAAALALSPRQFYGLRHWYAERDLGRLRNRIAKTPEVAAHPKAFRPS